MDKETPPLDDEQKNQEQPTESESLLSRFASWGNTLLWGPVAAVGFLILLVMLVQEGAYLACGSLTSGRVTAVGVEHKGSHEQGNHPRWYLHRVVYQFEDREGVTHQGERLSSEDTPNTSYYRGKPIEVQYLRHSPRISRTFAQGGHDARWGGLMVVLLLAGVLLLGTAWLSHWGGLQLLLFRLGIGRGRKRKTPSPSGPFPSAWEGILQRNVGLYRLLTEDEQENLRDDLRIFIAGKRWEGCAGLEITEEMQVTIAAQACMLLLGMDHDHFKAVKSILVYPTTFQLRQEMVVHGGVVKEGVPLLGQAWRRGPVLLAWDEVLAGGRDAHDGRNVVYHEFAHQLDFLGELGGLHPHQPEQFLQWQEVIRTEFARLVQETAQGHATLLDKYGAQSETEFFAVATECFFERPVPLQERHPQLYAMLRDYFGQDSAARFVSRDRMPGKET
jgi:MtfA peptidase